MLRYEDFDVDSEMGDKVRKAISDTQDVMDFYKALDTSTQSEITQKYNKSIIRSLTGKRTRYRKILGKMK